MSADSNDDGDILGDLLYVATNLDTVRQETIVLVIQAAVAEIVNLRIAVAMASRESG